MYYITRPHLRPFGAHALLKGGGQSQSTAATTNTSTSEANQTDNKIATSGTSIVAAGGSSVGEVTLESQDAATTQAAISASATIAERAISGNADTSKAALTSAENLGKYSFDAARDLGGAALDISKGISGQSFDFAKATQDNARATNRDTLAFTDSAISKASDAFAAAQGADTSKLQDTLTKIALGGLLICTAAYVLTRAK